MSKAHLCVVDGPRRFRVPLAVTPAGGLMLGSDAQGSVRLDSGGVAGQHALLLGGSGGWSIECLGLRRSLRVGGSPVRRAKLRHSDQFELGSAILELHDAEDCGCDDGAAPLALWPGIGTGADPAGGARSGSSVLPRLTAGLALCRWDWQLLETVTAFIAVELDLTWASAFVEEDAQLGIWRQTAAHDRRVRPFGALPRPRGALVARAFAEGGMVWDGDDRRRTLVIGLDAPAGGTRAVLAASDRERRDPVGHPECDLIALAALLADCMRPQLFALAASETRARRAEESMSAAAWTVQLFDAGESSRAVLERARRAGVVRVPVVIVGESGTGKELLAATIHRHSPMADRPFLHVDCGARSDAIEQALWDAGGRLHAEAAGTLFLDRLHRLPPRLQVRLAESLNCSFRPEGAAAGGNLPLVLAASELPLEELVARGELVERLGAQLGGITLTVPPLRERRQEIAPLATHLLAQISPHRQLRIASSALPLLEAHDWPGNLRELKQVLEQSTSDLHGDLVRPRDLPPHVRGEIPGEHDRHPLALRDVQRRHIEKRLEHNDGCITTTAKELGISRPRLYRMIEKLGIERREDEDADEDD